MARRGFSLVELMMVVAILATLAAIAIPLVADHQLKARRSEGMVNVEGLVDAGMAYCIDGSEDVVLGLWPRPGPALDKQAVPWSPNADGDPAPAGWSTLGWAPDGHVRCAYLVETHPVGVGEMGALGAVYCDVDDDGRLWQVRDAKWKSVIFRENTCVVGGPTCLVDGTGACDCF